MTPYPGIKAVEFLAQVQPGPYEPAYNWWWAWWVWVGGFIILMLIIFLIAYGVCGRPYAPRQRCSWLAHFTDSTTTGCGRDGGFSTRLLGHILPCRLWGNRRIATVAPVGWKTGIVRRWIQAEVGCRLLRCTMVDYAFIRELDVDFEAAVELVKEQLQNAGFGLIMALDMQEIFAEKLDIGFRPYLILGVCDPVNACKAIMAEESIGLMLPCNVVIYESERGRTTVGIIRPTVALKIIDNLDLHRIAMDVERRLKAVIDALQPAAVVSQA